MFERYLYDALNAVLGAYVRDLDPEKLKVAVWNGEVPEHATACSFTGPGSQ